MVSILPLIYLITTGEAYPIPIATTVVAVSTDITDGRVT